MNKDSLAMFVDINELDKRVQALAQEKLGQEDTETKNLYLNPTKGRFD